MLTASQCLMHPQDTAEAYLLGHMPKADAVVFRQHCLRCTRCQHALCEERKLIRAFGSAGRMVAARELPDDTSEMANVS